MTVSLHDVLPDPVPVIGAAKPALQGGKSRVPPRRSHRGVSMIGVTLAIILAVIALDRFVSFARIVFRDRLAAARAQGIILEAHDFDADLASLVRQGQTSFLAAIPSNGVISASSLPASGILLSTNADAPFGITPAAWTVERYIAKIATARGTLPFGLLYIKVSASDAAMMPALRASLVAQADASAALEPADPATLMATALGHPLDSATELAIFTAPFAGLDPAAVLRAPRAGWAGMAMTTSLDMAGHDIADAGSATTTLTSATTVSAGDLSATSAAIGGQLATPSAVIAGGLSARSLSATSLSAATGQIGSLTGNVLAADAVSGSDAAAAAFNAPEAAATATLSLPASTTVATGAVNDIGSPAPSGAGTVDAHKLQTSDSLAAAAGTFHHLTITSCNGC